MTEITSNATPVFCDACKAILWSDAESTQKIFNYLWHQFGKFQCCMYATEFLKRLERNPFFKTKLCRNTSDANGWVDISVLAIFPDPSNQQDYVMVSGGKETEMMIARQKNRWHTTPLSIHSTVYKVQKNSYGLLCVKPFHDPNEVLGGEETD